MDSPAWRKVDSNHQESLTSHGRYWWQRSGYALAILLEKSSYSYPAQLKHLDFFAQSVAPWLGVVNESGAEQWKSFMTDDYNPIEFSWDWSTIQKPPMIRYAVEPVGKDAGTPQDPYNQSASREFLQEMLRVLSPQDMQWFHYFDAYFNSVGMEYTEELHHSSKLFWAYGLCGEDIVGKIYFNPDHLATATGKTRLEVISEAIEAAPLCNPQNLVALYIFQEYVREQGEANMPLEMESLAIDLVEPSKSRLKIYFRSRQTSFQSVRNIMTLGGRLIDKSTKKDAEKGLRNLRRLWDSLFNQRGVSEESPLPNSDHLTAGILYYVDFRLGSNAPTVKIYLPVRHYAKNDWQIMKAVSRYMSSNIMGIRCTAFIKRNTYPLAFCKAMSRIFGEDSLRRQTGKQTYVSCSIQPGGALRVTSYINPRIDNAFHTLDE